MNTITVSDQTRILLIELLTLRADELEWLEDFSDPSNTVVTALANMLIAMQEISGYTYPSFVTNRGVGLIPLASAHLKVGEIITLDNGETICLLQKYTPHTKYASRTDGKTWWWFSAKPGIKQGIG